MICNFYLSNCLRLRTLAVRISILDFTTNLCFAHLRIEKSELSATSVIITNFWRPPALDDDVNLGMTVHVLKRNTNFY